MINLHFRSANVYLRLTLIFFLVISFLFTVISLILGWRLERAITDNRIKHARETIFWAAGRMEHQDLLYYEDLTRLSLQLSYSSVPDFHFAVLDASGQRIGPPPSQPSDFTGFQIPEKNKSSGEPYSFLATQDGDSFRTIFYSMPVLNANNSIIGYVQATIRLDEGDPQVRNLKYFLLIVLGITGAILIILLSLIVRLSLLPLRDITSIIESASKGNFKGRARVPYGKDEIRVLVESYNRMIEQIDQAFSNEKQAQEQLRNFLADSSHELKTPLTVIRGFTDLVLRSKKMTEEDIKFHISSIQRETNRMINITNDLLVLSRMQAKIEFHIEECDISQLCEEVSVQVGLAASDRKVLFESGGDIKIKCDADKMRQVMLNLLSNAVDFCPPGETVSVATKLTGEICTITVSNPGQSLKQEDLPNLFNRFYRGRSQGSRQGSGLGLAISKAIVEAHRGTIIVETWHQMTIFTVSLPRSSFLILS